MSNPKVSVIIPVYNSADFIEDCVKNILEQTYENLRVILVDDGSTDNSRSLCEGFEDERVTVLSKPNGGASSARNLGLESRDGKYVLFVDSDDTLRCDAVELLVRKAEETGADCVYFEAENIAADDSIKIKKNGLKQSADYPQTDGSTLTGLLLDNKNYHAVPFLYFVKSEIFNSGLRFEEGIMFEDELFSFELLRSCGKVVCLREPLYFRQVRKGSVMTSGGRELFRFKSMTVVFDRLFERYGSCTDGVSKRYLARVGMLWLGYCEALKGDFRKQAAQDIVRIKRLIKAQNGFGSRALLARTRGKAVWVCYIAPGRIIKKLRRR